MKAVVVTALGGPEVLAVQDQSKPQPGAGQVLIRVFAASVNFADVKARQGRYHGAGEPPFVPGLDVAGVVESTGPGVFRVSPGMRVAAFPHGGSYAEYVVASEALVFPIPENLSWAEAASLPIVAFTAYALLTEVGQMDQGESVLVHAAAGGVGTTVVQMAKSLGAGVVIGVVGRSEKIGLVRELGADEVIDSSRESFPERVAEITEGRGVDVVLDSIGGHVSEDSLTCLARFGRLVHFGSASGEIGRIAVADLHASCRSVRGFSLGTVRRERPEAIAPIADAVLKMALAGDFRMLIGRRFPLHEAEKAHRWIESRESVGKIVLDVAAE